MQDFQQDWEKKCASQFLLMWVAFLPVVTLTPNIFQNDLNLEHPPSSV